MFVVDLEIYLIYAELKPIKVMEKLFRATILLVMHVTKLGILQNFVEERIHQ